MSTNMATRCAAAIGLFTALLAPSVFPCHTSAALIGHWQFEDGGGFLLDSSGNDNTLSMQVPSGGSNPVQYTLLGSGPGSAFFDPIPDIGVPNAYAAYTGDASGGWFIRSPEDTMNPEAFTIEALVHLTTANTGSNSTMIASRWYDTDNQRAWGFGVATSDAGGFTGTNPKTEQGLFLALSSDGIAVTSTVDSRIQIETGRDYYVATTYAPPAGDTDGSVAFYVKDLTNRGPLQTATLQTKTSVFKLTTGQFEIGSLNANNTYRWKGYIDEVRFSDTPLTAGQLMIGPLILPPANPTFSWLLDGDATAYVGGQDGTAFGTPTITYPSTNPPAPLAYDGNQYASFTAEQHIDFGNDAALQITDAITASMWFNTNDARTTATRYLVNNWNAGAGERSWAIGVGSINSAGELRLLLSGDGSTLSHDYRSTFDVNDGEWHHLAFTFDSEATQNQARLFLDGVELVVGAGLVKTSENTITALNLSNDKLIAGRRGDASPAADTYYSGLLDEVAIWKSVLSGDEIAWLASNSIRAIPEPGMFTLLVLGLLGFAVPLRRRRRQA